MEHIIKKTKQLKEYLGLVIMVYIAIFIFCIIVDILCVYKFKNLNLAIFANLLFIIPLWLPYKKDRK